MFFPNFVNGDRIISKYTGVMLLTVSGIPVCKEAFFAFSEEKKGVSNDIQRTSIPCFLNTNALKILSSPPEHKPRARTGPDLTMYTFHGASLNS
jgi:hypothetical protein